MVEAATSERLQMNSASEHSAQLPSVDPALGWHRYDPEKLEVDAGRGDNESPPAVINWDIAMDVMDIWHEEPGSLGIRLVAIVAYYLLRLTVLPKPFGDRLGEERWLWLIPQLLLTIFHSILVIGVNALRLYATHRGQASSDMYAMKLRNSLEVKILGTSELVCALSSLMFFTLDIITAFTESPALRDLLRYLAFIVVSFGGIACVFAYLCREFILNWPLYDKGYSGRVDAMRRELAAMRRERVVIPDRPTANNPQTILSNCRNVTTVVADEVVIINYGNIHNVSGPPEMIRIIDESSST